MKWFVQQWNSLKFIITPSELEEVLSGFHHIISNARVPYNYIDSDQKEFFGKYKAFYEKLSSSYKFGKIDEHIMDLYIGITNDLSRHQYGEKFLDTKEQKWYKTTKFEEACVNISPFAFRLDSKGRMSTQYFWGGVPYFTVGLDISFPKKIYYCVDPKTNIIDRFTDSSEFSDFTTYQTIISRIKSISKNLTFELGGKVYKTSVKISGGAKEDFKNFYFIKSSGSEL
jgi:hypothetical protein